MEAKLTLRDAHRSDLEALLSIQKASPGAARWTRDAYESLLAADGTLCLVAQGNSEERMGFVLARIAADEMEILNLAVRPVARRRGLGRRLVEEALARARGRGARQCWLEVRASNRAALEFYRALGFKERARRTGYYRDPVEDAVICARSLAP
ncbi:MAG TPA: ribosomal protein S18-alanine N-acetyltransferase [Candidatus Xenobia bacterium]|nr:ribosomal protein S18-alanine N-acetyltransferase [Candidatus Xenobia bacterium]